MRAVTLVGVAALKAKLVKRRKESYVALTRGLIRAARKLRRWSMKIVPVDTNTLRLSCYEPRVSNGGTAKVEVTIGYTAGYAIYVHEDPMARHKPGKQYKFLEGPLREHYQELLDTIAEEL